MNFEEENEFKKLVKKIADENKEVFSTLAEIEEKDKKERINREDENEDLAKK